MNKTLFLLILLPLLLINTSVALEKNYYFPRNEDKNFRFQCLLDTGEFCPDSYGCNWTVINPNNELIISNGQFTNNVNFYNYTINASLLSTRGDYYAMINCFNGSDGESSSFIFQVNDSGQESSPFYVISIFLAVGLMVIVYLIAGLKMNDEHFKLKAFMFIASFINLDVLLFFGYFVQVNIFVFNKILLIAATLNGLIVFALSFYYFMYIWKKRQEELENM